MFFSFFLSGLAVLNALKVALHQIKLMPGQSSRCTVKFIRSECNEGCDWCIYVTVVTCAYTLTSTLCRVGGGGGWTMYIYEYCNIDDWAQIFSG